MQKKFAKQKKGSTFAKKNKPIMDNKPIVVEEIYNLVAACALLGITERTLAEYLRDGKIKGYKKMGRWYVLKSDLIEFLKDKDVMFV